MVGLFLDSSGWFAAMSPRDSGHIVAKKAYASAASSGVELVSTTLVIAEVHTLVLRWRGPEAGLRFLSLALDSGVHHVVVPDAELLDGAVGRWLRRFVDKPISLCDAASFETMRRRHLTRALTFDRHFKIAGFEIL